MNNLRFVKEDETDIVERKKRLRAYMKGRRADNENRDMKEERLTKNALSLVETLFGEKIAKGERLRCFCYLSYSSEAGTDTLVEKLQEKGVEVLCPKVEGKEMVAVALGEDCALSKWGIREPVGEADTGEMDCIILPLLAVDRQGNRLGYGGGYYDRFLQNHPNAVTVAYCYDFQIVQSVPTERTDKSVQYIVTDKRIEKTKEKRRCDYDEIQKNDEKNR